MNATDFSLRVVAAPEELLKLEKPWDSFVSKFSANPFFLNGFVRQFVRASRFEGWRPTCLVLSSNATIGGLVLLSLRERLGVRFAKPLLRDWFSPDFLLKTESQDKIINQTMKFLFERLQLQIIELTFPCDSPNLQMVRESCRKGKYRIWERATVGHCIIPVDKSWEAFEKIRGSNFRRRFRRLERNLHRAGPWKIVRKNLDGDSRDEFEKILEVERRSWKREWRARKKVKLDQDLHTLFQVSQSGAKSPDFELSVWFLVLNDRTLAYSLVVGYKRVAFIAKTSYDQRYRSLYPGIYINNVVVKELFSKAHVKAIDWCTDLPFHRNWTSICRPRVRVLISQKGAIPSILGFLGASVHTRDVRLAASKFLDPLLRSSSSTRA